MQRIFVFPALLAALACGTEPDKTALLHPVGAFAFDLAATGLPNHGVELAVVGNDGNVWRSICEKPCKAAQGFSDFMRDAGSPPVGAASSPSLVSRTSDRLDIFVLGGDAAIWHQTWDRSYWLGWESLGAPFVSAPAAVSWANDRIDLIAVDNRGILEHRYCVVLGVPGCRAGNWQPWEGALGRPTTGIEGDPSAVSSSSDHIDMVVLGGDGAIYHKSWDKGWSGWRSLGGEFKYAPAMTARGSTLEVFAVDDVGKLWLTTGSSKRF
ncbi:MAG TPA: hypothetical protein VGP93_14070, partial [Polyangiaceae bacterium]|nr:hypothetical protein [Polyangiaceae bacterium]